ncbi:hypothetical protein G6O67_007100 [Ophiocordyceps sinensis]|uniref:Uncharacterized protein n=1 Tax=Ophiocordyceps sinensis TaxID=72228 RepID=A0A8H4PKH6_9HYPO|nr:hypothetical protein G6O67_007100 [Ophiocordyceps sinensis]
MKFAAVATAVLAGVAQAAVSNQAMSQDLAANMEGAGDMDGMTLLNGIYNVKGGKGGRGGRGGQGGIGVNVGGGNDIASILKKATCALPCVDRAARKVPCSGKNLVAGLCGSIDKVKQGSEGCVRKCGVDQSLIDLAAKGAHFLCSRRGKLY